MATVLVTGATGNIGSRVVGELRARDVPVRAFVRDPGKAATILGEDIDLAVGDFGEPASIRRAMEGVDRVFLACANSPRQVEYETNVIDAAVASGGRRIVKLSAIGAEVGSPLAFWDWQGHIERHLGASGLPASILWPSFYMTGLIGSAEPIKHTGTLFAPLASARIAMIDPRDVAAAAVALIEHGPAGQTFHAPFHLTGPEAISYGEVARHLSAATGRPIEFVHVPDEAARQGLAAAGIPSWLAEQLVILFGLLRKGVQAQTTDTVRVLTGREPGAFAQFARDHAAAFQI